MLKYKIPQIVTLTRGFVYYMLLSMGILLNGNTKVPTLNFI